MLFFPSSLIVWHMHTMMGFLLLGGIPSRRTLQLKGRDVVCFWRMEVQAWISFSSSSRDLHTLLPMARRLDHIIHFPGRKRWKYLDAAATDHKALPANKADLPYKQLYILQVISLFISSIKQCLLARGEHKESTYSNMLYLNVIKIQAVHLSSRSDSLVLSTRCGTQVAASSFWTIFMLASHLNSNLSPPSVRKKNPFTSILKWRTN